MSKPSTDPYELLSESLNRLPNGFPRTPSRIELRILRKIFSPEEAELACLLTGTMEPDERIAERATLPTLEARKLLLAMAKRGFVWFSKEEGRLRFRLAPFIVGIYEAQVDTMDHELAHLVEDYLAQGGAAGIMKPQPALHRVVPVRGSAKTEWILPYDDVRGMLVASESFAVHDCVCRRQEDLLKRRACSVPVRNCLTFSKTRRRPGPDSIKVEEALAVLDEAEQASLVHTVSNVVDGVSYVCNCCGCCCGILRGVTQYGIRQSVARANYVAAIDPRECADCGRCATRCQVKAISRPGETPVVDPRRCIGCGLCVTTCPTHAASLSPLPPESVTRPPADYAAWERLRLANRGLA